MLAALRHGLPQVIIPYDGDNVRNARLCEAAGVAIQIPLKEISTELVRAGADRMLHDPALTASARVLRDQIRDMPSPAAVVPILERLAAGARSPR